MIVCNRCNVESTLALLRSGHARCPRGVCFVIITVLVAVTVLVQFDELPCVSAVWGLKIVCERERERFISLTISVQLYYNSLRQLLGDVF